MFSWFKRLFKKQDDEQEKVMTLEETDDLIAKLKEDRRELSRKKTYDLIKICYLSHSNDDLDEIYLPDAYDPILRIGNFNGTKDEADAIAYRIDSYNKRYSCVAKKDPIYGWGYCVELTYCGHVAVIPVKTGDLEFTKCIEWELLNQMCREVNKVTERDFRIDKLRTIKQMKYYITDGMINQKDWV